MECNCDSPDPSEERSEMDVTLTQMECKVNYLEQLWTRPRTNYGTARSINPPIQVTS